MRSFETENLDDFKKFADKSVRIAVETLDVLGLSAIIEVDPVTKRSPAGINTMTRGGAVW